MGHGKIRVFGAAVLVVLCVAGCGSGAEQREALPPTLPRPLALALADRSDAVAQALDAGDSCRAIAAALELQQRTIAAINAHRVPGPLQEPLQSRVNDLVERVPRCSPPPRDEDEKEPGRGHGKGKGKNKHGKGDD